MDKDKFSVASIVSAICSSIITSVITNLVKKPIESIDSTKILVPMIMVMLVIIALHLYFLYYSRKPTQIKRRIVRILSVLEIMYVLAAIIVGIWFLVRNTALNDTNTESPQSSITGIGGTVYIDSTHNGDNIINN